jgi:hypothetical protein
MSFDPSMAWLAGLTALLGTGLPEGLSWKQRLKLFRTAERTGLRPALVMLQRRKLLGGRELNAARQLLRGIEDRPLIFIVSFHKTGTRSVHQYLEQLGLRGLHWPVFTNCGIDYPPILEPYANDADRCVTALAPVLAKFDFFGDVPFPGLYASLSRSFRNARFIVIERDPDQWWESVARHWKLDERDRVLESLEAIQYGLPVGTRLDRSSRDDLIRRYRDHLAAITRHFDGSGRMLRTPLDDPDINHSISSFLAIDEAPPFPKIRKGAIHRETAH